MSATVVVERTGALVRVQLTRPERHNALVPETWHALRRLGDDLLADPEVRVVLVHGAGGSFCSGIDRRAMAEGAMTPYGLTGDEADRDRTTYEERDIVAAQGTCRWLIDGPFVSIAAVRGFALGAGAQIAMACDMRVVGTDAQFALPEIEIGLFPELSAVARLPAIVGYDRALDLALTGRRIDAAEADRLGLATRLTEPDAVLGEATALAEQIASARPEAVLACKRAMQVGAAGDTDGALRVAREGALPLLRGLMTEWT